MNRPADFPPPWWQHRTAVCEGSQRPPRQVADTSPPELPGWRLGLCSCCDSVVWVNEARLECYCHEVFVA